MGMGEGEGEGWDVVHDVTRRRERDRGKRRKGREGEGGDQSGPVQVGPSRFPRQTQCMQRNYIRKRFGERTGEPWDQLGGRRAYSIQDAE